MKARTFRILSLIVPSALAATLAVRVDQEQILHTVAPVLVMLWVFMAGALVMRFVEGRDYKGGTITSHWEHVDLLTASGASLMWTGAAALILARISGWASLSVIGILGLGTTYLAVAWNALAAGGMDRWRRTTVERVVEPEVAIEGEPLRETVRLKGVHIPAGMRLFIAGRAMRHGAVSRYVVGSDRSRAEIELHGDIGTALRGEHRSPLLQLWLGDVLGLTRAPIVHRAEAAFTVLPKPGVVDGAQHLLGAGGDSAMSQPAHQLPTEGTFRIREYVPGDDTRRIHWVRSAQQDTLVVRLPDEIPPADPVVRVILDNDLFGTDTLTCRAPDELLDALVRVWLGIGKALSERGARVTLVTAIDHGGTLRRVERRMAPRSPREATRLGARVTWQAVLPIEQLIGRRDTARQIVVSARPRRVASPAEITWVVVPEVAWTTGEDTVPFDMGITHLFPLGSAENRGSRRTREARRIAQVWQDRMLFSQVVCWTDWLRYSGDHVARPCDGRIILGVIP